jgi:hypothetical protein
LNQAPIVEKGKAIVTAEIPSASAATSAWGRLANSEWRVRTAAYFGFLVLAVSGFMATIELAKRAFYTHLAGIAAQ